ncbi:MAG: succinylglutamate desuccinylase/aspartoacylase family protein, partial [Gammaproteobacteria bacterium]|nr:succinylglutamate desuccinylase/aspartoacylase family protein [Gammaproteobacteria bacterium]
MPRLIQPQPDLKPPRTEKLRKFFCLAVCALAITALGACDRKPSTTPPVPAKTTPATPTQDQPAVVPVGMRGGQPIELLGESIPPGTMRRLLWSAGQSFDGSSDQTPVLVINGTGKGPTLCLTGAIHGDELNGIEIVRRVTQDLEPARIRGAVIGIPIVNLQGFRRGSRYLPDRRDLNRHFPGNPGGSAASRIAWSLFDGIIRHCDGLVDVHTGSLSRTNLPQLRADLRDAKIRDFVQGFGGMLVLHNPGRPGTLRYAAAKAGIPAVTLEAGEPGRLQSA